MGRCLRLKWQRDGRIHVFTLNFVKMPDGKITWPKEARLEENLGARRIMKKLRWDQRKKAIPKEHLYAICRIICAMTILDPKTKKKIEKPKTTLMKKVREGEDFVTYKVRLTT